MNVKLPESAFKVTDSLNLFLQKSYDNEIKKIPGRHDPGFFSCRQRVLKCTSYRFTALERDFNIILGGKRPGCMRTMWPCFKRIRICAV